MSRITEFLSCLSKVCISAIHAINEPSALNSLSMLHTSFLQEIQTTSGLSPEYWKDFLLSWEQDWGQQFCYFAQWNSSIERYILDKEKEMFSPGYTEDPVSNCDYCV